MIPSPCDAKSLQAEAWNEGFHFPALICAPQYGMSSSTGRNDITSLCLMWFNGCDVSAIDKRWNLPQLIPANRSE